MRHLPLLAVLALCACSAPPAKVSAMELSVIDESPEAVASSRLAAAIAAPPPAPQRRRRRPMNYFNVMLGASYWDNLGSLDTSGVSPFPGRFGDFDRWGFTFDMGYDRVVRSSRKFDWTLGLEMGWASFWNDGTGLTSPYGNISANVFHLTPTSRLLFPVSSAVTVAPGIGAGYYSLDIVETEVVSYGWWWAYNSFTLNRDSAFGGFASVAVDFNTSPNTAVRLDNKVHFVTFTGLDSLMPNESTVSGPIWTIELGFVARF